jgi:hypothetical protein
MGGEKEEPVNTNDSLIIRYKEMLLLK